MWTSVHVMCFLGLSTVDGEHVTTPQRTHITLQVAGITHHPHPEPKRIGVTWRRAEGDFSCHCSIARRDELRPLGIILWLTAERNKSEPIHRCERVA